MNKKLYIVLFITSNIDIPNGVDFADVWANDTEQAEEEVLNAVNGLEQKEDILDVHLVSEAVKKKDILDTIKRYLIKPLNK